MVEVKVPRIVIPNYDDWAGTARDVSEQEHAALVEMLQAWRRDEVRRSYPMYEVAGGIGG